MIKLKDLSIGYHNKPLLQNVNTKFQDTKLTALIGRNGSGKSTLLKTLCGLNHKYEGEILINGKNINEYTAGELSKTISFVHTDRPRIPNMKCRDIVAMGRSPYTGWSGKLREKDKIIIEESLAKVNMLNYADRNLESLSDGESQKIMIARAIAQDTRIILLDEPTSFLDLPTRYELVTLLKELADRGEKTVIFSTHELDIALKLSDNIALFDPPRLVILPVKEMLDSGLLQKLFPILKIF